jgi:membrane protease YdiL (CAAX protease family)
MDVSTLLWFGGAIAYFGITMYLANAADVQGERSPVVNALLYGSVAIVFFFGLFTLQLAVIELPANEFDQPIADVPLSSAVPFFAWALLAAALMTTTIQVASFRAWLRRRLPARATYSTDSQVHTTAVVFALLLLTLVLGQVVQSGGLSGLAESISVSQVTIGDTLFQQVLWVFAAALGCGLFLRRTPAGLAGRLGLRWPTAGDVVWGIGAAVFMYGGVIVIGLVWSLLSTPEEIEAQTTASRALLEAFNTLPLAFIISLLVAFGEEIFFRGALQPVFGIWLTSLYFALLHNQYTLTPASVAIFLVALVLAVLRQRQSTTATIIAHFLYNFIQFALAILLGSLSPT